MKSHFITLAIVIVGVIVAEKYVMPLISKQ
jgi:hypothetical protein